MRRATLIPGDGIGPEITAATLRVLEAAGAEFEWDRHLAGMTAMEEEGTPLPDATIESLRSTRLGLKGPLTTPVGSGFRSVNVALRKEFDLYANVRPAKTLVPGGRYDGVDIDWEVPEAAGEETTKASRSRASGGKNKTPGQQGWESWA